MRYVSPMKKSLLLPLGLLVAAALIMRGRPATAAETIGYAEQFALAEDWAKALEQLIPGTEDYYFYHALLARLDRPDYAGLVRD